MFIQKLYKTGNSIAVTIPHQLLDELDLKEGQEVVVEKLNNRLTVTSKANKLAKSVNPEFMEMVDEFMDEHDDVLKELAQK